jgi:hypothetical protein
MFCEPGLIFGGTNGVGSHFHVLRSRARFRRYRGRRVPFSCFVRTTSFSAAPRASGPVFMFRAHGLIFGGTEGVGSRFPVLRTRTRLRWCRVCRVPFSCFALPESFSAVARASSPVFMFWVPELIFGGTVGVRSCFQVFRVRNLFRRYRGRRVPLSSFALPDSFSAVPSASDPVFKLCAP